MLHKWGSDEYESMLDSFMNSSSIVDCADCADCRMYKVETSIWKGVGCGLLCGRVRGLIGLPFSLILGLMFFGGQKCESVAQCQTNASGWKIWVPYYSMVVLCQCRPGEGIHVTGTD